MNRYKHAEAYCLMTYECKKCGRRETIWNSRDGVTPYTTNCRYCGGEAKHVDFHLDEYQPFFKPITGVRIFRDMTEQDKVEIATKRLESFKGTEYHPESEEKYAEILQGIIASFRQGEPISEIIE